MFDLVDDIGYTNIRNSKVKAQVLVKSAVSDLDAFTINGNYLVDLLAKKGAACHPFILARYDESKMRVP